MDLRHAIEMALNELGVPQPGYPQPVANAVEILQTAIGRPLTVQEPVDKPRDLRNDEAESHT